MVIHHQIMSESMHVYGVSAPRIRQFFQKQPLSGKTVCIILDAAAHPTLVQLDPIQPGTLKEESKMGSNLFTDVVMGQMDLVPDSHVITAHLIKTSSLSQRHALLTILLDVECPSERL